MKSKLLLLAFALIIVCSACEKSSNVNFESGDKKDTNFVTLERVFQLSGVENPTQKDLKKISSMSTDISKSRMNREVTPFYGKSKKPIFYVVNYKEGGFIIIAADKRYYPILAVSESSSFPMRDTTFLPGVSNWVAEISNSISELRKDDENPKTKKIEIDIAKSKIIKAAWTKLDYAYVVENKLSYERGDFPPCERPYDGNSVMTHYGIYSKTLWDQGNGYNDALPNYGCTWDFQGQPYTGCIATSMGQLMHYYSYPSTFSWSGMALNSGNTAVAALLADIGTKVSMNYSCSGSSATFNSAKNALITYGYSVNKSSFDWNIAVQASRWEPFLIAGGTHAWLCNGSLNNEIWSCERDFRTGELYWENIGFWDMLYMNWGWGGQFDGYYSNGNFNPNGANYNSNTEVIYATP